MAETIGLDIGSHSIKIVGLKAISKGLFLTALGMKEIAQGKEEGDTHALIETLSALLKEVSFKSKSVRVAVSGRGINLIRLSLPSMPRIEMLEAIRWEIKEQLPFPIETARIDFHILDEFVEEGVKKLDLMVVACPTQLADRTLSVAKGAGLETSHLGVVPFALWSALASDDRPGKEEVIVLVDLGSAKTGIHLFKNGSLQFSREVTPAGEDITRAIMEGLGGETNPDLLYEQAEKIKQTTGIRLEDNSEGQDEVLNAAAAGEPLPHTISIWIRPVMERLVSEISRSLDYYRGQFNVEQIDQVFVTGGGAGLRNIAPFLSNELHLPVEVFNPLKAIPFDAKKVDGQFLNQGGSHFTVALGLALPEGRRIELLPAREPLWSKVHLRGRGMIHVLIPFLALLGFFGIFSKMNGEAASLQRDLDSKMAQAQDLEAMKAKLTQLKEKQERTRREISIAPVSSSLPIPYQGILNEMSQLVPDNMALTLFEIGSRGKRTKKGSASQKSPVEEPLKDGQKELHLSGIVFGNDIHCLMALARVMEGLEKSPFFKNAKLISADENREYSQPGTEFEIACEINQGNHPTLMKETPEQGKR